MSYSDFNMESVRRVLGLAIIQKSLFAAVEPIAPSAWLNETLAKAKSLAFYSEKSRSEFIVAPILLACRETSGNAFHIYSGINLEGDAARGLRGECDFVLAKAPPSPALQSPIAVIVEAKKNDVEAGIGQCIAQMYGARIFNEKDQNQSDEIFGCVTTGEIWQFLKLQDQTAFADADRYYLEDVDRILGIFKTITESVKSN